MSDSDTDVLSNEVFGYRDEPTRVCAMGPNITTNLTNFSFRNNSMMPPKNLAWPRERSRYTESVCDQRSMYRRETSPMSFRSTTSARPPRNFHHSFYPDGMSSQRSMYNGRSGSPMSVRTIDSNTSLSAADIAFALKTAKFNKFDLRIIQDAYKKFMQKKVRKRIEKRRNLKMFLKKYRRYSRGDSGDQASDSSISSDDRRSVTSYKSTMLNDNASYQSMNTNRNYFSTDFRQSHFQNMVPSDSGIQNPFMRPNNTSMMLHRNGSFTSSVKSQKERQYNASIISQKERFSKGFLLPSQRFNVDQSVASMIIPEMHSSHEEQVKNSTTKGVGKPNQSRGHKRKSVKDSDSEDEIFADVTVSDKLRDTTSMGNKNLENSRAVSYEKKRKLSSPQLAKTKPISKTQTKTFTKGNDFEFVKPQLPVRKTIGNPQKEKAKAQQKQVPIAKEPQKVFTKNSPPKIVVSKPPEKTATNNMNAQELEDKIISQSHPPMQTDSPSSKLQSKKQPQPLSSIAQKENNSEKDQDISCSTTDVSMRPSFIKRKLFTQKISEADKSGSSDSLLADTSQSDLYGKIQKEKNKARKLVTQSCLSRDLGDDSNLLDLIHKIVPADRMNLTAVTNRSEIQSNKNKPNNGDKWDVTTVIAKDMSGDLSDTFTDEEIFNGTKQNNTKNDKQTGKKNQSQANKKRELNRSHNNSKDKTNLKVNKLKKNDKSLQKEQNNQNQENNKKVQKQTNNQKKDKMNEEINKKKKKETGEQKEQNHEDKENQKKGQKQPLNHSKDQSNVEVKKIKNKYTEPQKCKELPQKKIAASDLHFKGKCNNNDVGDVPSQCAKEVPMCQGNQQPVRVTRKSLLLEKTTTPINNFKQPVTANTRNQHQSSAEKKDIKEKAIHCVKSFWDTDTESDYDMTPVKKLNHSKGTLNDSSFNKTYNTRNTTQVRETYLDKNSPKDKIMDTVTKPAMVKEGKGKDTKSVQTNKDKTTKNLQANKENKGSAKKAKANKVQPTKGKQVNTVNRRGDNIFTSLLKAKEVTVSIGRLQSGVLADKTLHSNFNNTSYKMTRSGRQVRFPYFYRP